MKIQMVYDRAFWRDDGLSGNCFAISNTIVPQTLDAGGPAGEGKGKNEPGILGVFIDDDVSRDLGRLSESERKERILKELVPRFGDQIFCVFLRRSSRTTSNSHHKTWEWGSAATTPVCQVHESSPHRGSARHCGTLSSASIGQAWIPAPGGISPSKVQPNPANDQRMR